MTGELLGANARVLVVRLRSLGDVLLSTVIASAVHRARPDATVDYLVDEAFAGATHGCEGVSDEIVWPSSWAGRLALQARLARRYDVALDLYGVPASAVLSRLASRGIAIGFERRSDATARMYDRVASVGDPSDHTAAVNLHLLDELGLARPSAPELHVAVDDAVRARFRLGSPSAIIHAGGRFAHKLWPASRFRAVADALVAKGYRVSLLVGPGESVAPELGGLNQIRGVPARELASTLSAFDLFVGNDSGPMHFAASAGCAVVGIFGPSDPRRWRPLTPRGIAIAPECACGFGWQQPCRFPERWCLETVTVDAVMSAIGRVESVPATGGESPCHEA